MTVRTVFKVAERWAIDNAPTLLTAFGVTGTLATAYLTGKATFKAAELIREEETNRELQELSPEEGLTKSEKIKLTWKCYIPPAISVATTVGCIVAANTISMSRAAALAAGMAIMERNMGEYKDKVQEVFGEKKANEVRSSIAQDAVNNTPMVNVERSHGGNTLCFDKWTGRYFTGDMQSIRAAENDIAKGLYRGTDRVATLGDFYQCLGISVPRCAEEIGWNADSPIDLIFDTVIKDDQPVLVMDFANTPFPISGVFGTS